MKENNLVLDKSLSFAVRVVNLYKFLKKCDERVLATQILKSGTSIGANVREAMRAQSRNDFVAKMNIALKEAFETEYWLEVLHRTDFITQKEFDSMFTECRELTNILSKIIITTKERS
ncbi:MAG: four helix bundle protein [Rikenellaceae bacterium]|nr:four helix bundle protein [Rikenellaceae bacterium]MBQ3255540.1 four helix bundle protein [Rikenellaceae bacterium]